MDSPPTSANAIRFLSVDGQPIAEVPEWMPALIALDIDLDQWESSQLLLQGAPLASSIRRLQGVTQIVADWPRSGPGHYRLDLEAGALAQSRHITIRPRKISEAAYEQLLADLETRLPATVAIVLQRAGALAGTTLPPPGETTLAQELQRLRTAILGTHSRPGLARVLVDLASDPHRVLKRNEFWVRQERARRPAPSRFAQALVLSNNLDASHRPTRVIDSRVEESVDVYENRLVLAFYHQVHLRLRRLLGALSAQRLVDTFTEAHHLLDEIVAARRRASFLDEVSLPAHLTTPLTMVLIKRPPYRAALEGFLEFHRSVSVRLEEPALETPLANLPFLYQVWGTLEVLAAVLEVAGGLGYRVEVQRLASRDATGLYVRILPDGKPAVILHHPDRHITVQVIPQRSYGRRGALHSISYTQIPDLAIEISRPDKPATVYLFDPKYKLDGESVQGEIGGRPTKVDIDTMHAYRDAIRDGSDTRVVRYAAILYPGPLEQFGNGIEALPAYPTAEYTLRKTLRLRLMEALDSPFTE
jgi:hypothetical protein